MMKQEDKIKMLVKLKDIVEKRMKDKKWIANYYWEKILKIYCSIRMETLIDLKD